MFIYAHKTWGSLHISVAAELDNGYISNTYENFFNFLGYFSLLRGDFLRQTPGFFMGKFLYLNSQLRFCC